MRTFISDSVVSMGHDLSILSPFRPTDHSALRADVPFSIKMGSEASENAFIPFIIPFSVQNASIINLESASPQISRSDLSDPSDLSDLSGLANLSDVADLTVSSDLAEKTDLSDLSDLSHLSRFIRCTRSIRFIRFIRYIRYMRFSKCIKLLIFSIIHGFCPRFAKSKPANSAIKFSGFLSISRRPKFGTISEKKVPQGYLLLYNPIFSLKITAL